MNSLEYLIQWLKEMWVKIDFLPQPEQKFKFENEDYSDNIEDFEMWITDRIPFPPKGTVCECNQCSSCEEDASGKYQTACTREATTYLYRIEASHVCYTYMCEDCMEVGISDDYLADVDLPSEIREPRHCA